MSKHCSNIYFRCKTTVLAVVTLSVTVLLLLTDVTTVLHLTTKLLVSNIAKKYVKKYR